jgi:hypothetical protein
VEIRFGCQGLAKKFDFLIDEYVEKVILCLLEYLDPESQHFNFLLNISFLLEVLEHILYQLLL